MNLFQDAPKKFLFCFFLTFPLAIFAIIIFNILIDPYDIFHIISVRKVNAVKPYVADHLRIQKAHAVKYFHPTAILLGSSRTELGMDPEHPGFKKLGLKAYDMGMSGSGIYEIYRNLQHAYYATNKKLKLAIIELDPFMFNANREKIIFTEDVLDYDENRLLSPASQSYFFKTFLHDADAILFKTALRASYLTLTNQDSKELYQVDGMRNQEKNGMAIRIVTTGPRKEFVDNERYYMDRVWTIGKEKRFCTDFLGENRSTFDILRLIVQFARENNIELRFFTSPSHARYILSLKESGLWGGLVEFKHGIVNVLAEDAENHPNLKPFPLWDFMNFNSITTESVPISVHEKMQWHWEVSHFKKATGNLVLDKILGYVDHATILPADFGVLLTKNNVQFQLQKTLNDSEIYAKKFPEYIAEIKTSAQSVFSGRDGSMCTNAYKLYYAAIEEREHGNAEKAVRLLQDALKLQKEEQQEAKLQRIVYRDVGLAKMIRFALLSTQETLSTWIAYLKRGNEEWQAGNIKSATYDFDRAIEEGPAKNYLRGISYMQHQEYDQAIKEFKSILKSDPSNNIIKLLLQQSEVKLSMMKKVN